MVGRECRLDVYMFESARNPFNLLTKTTGKMHDLPQISWKSQAPRRDLPPQCEIVDCWLCFKSLSYVHVSGLGQADLSVAA